MPTTTATTTTSPIDTATKAAKNAFYVTVGLGVMGFQQAKEGQDRPAQLVRDAGLRRQDPVRDVHEPAAQARRREQELGGPGQAARGASHRPRGPLRGHPRQPAGEPARAGGRAHEASA